jgi:hypothetical protein
MATKIYRVQAPDGSIIRIEGPVGASQEEVIAKAQELMASRSEPTQYTEEKRPTGFLDYLRTQPVLEPFTRQTIRGAVVDPINALRQLTTEGQREAVAREEQAYQAERERLGEEGFEYGRLVGNILSPASLGLGTLAAKTVGGAGKLAGIRQAAAAGGAGALLQPIVSEEVDFADEKIRQLGLGVVLGGLFQAGIQAVKGGSQFLEELSRPMREEGRKELLRNFISKLAGNEKDQFIKAISNAEEIVAGAKPTVAEAIADIPGATGIATFQKQLASDAATSPGFITRELQQEAARLAAISTDDTAIPMLQSLRSAQTMPLREEALAQANIAGQIAPRLEADIAQRQASRISALQTQGQLQTRGAEQGVLAQTDFTPVPGQPRVSSRWRPNIDRSAEAIDAAKDAGDIAAQRLAESNFKKLQLQSLADEGFYALKINPIISRIDDILALPGERSEVAEKTLGALRTKLIDKTNANGVIDSRDLYTIRKEIATDIKKFADETKAPVEQRLASLETSLKKTIDSQIEKAGGVKWKDYLKNYQEFSEKINRIEIGRYLENKLQTPLASAERAGSFALAVEDAAKTIKRASGQSRYQSLGEVLTESERKAVNAVLADLQRSAKADRLMGQASLKGAGVEETPEIPMLFSRVASIGNFLFKGVKRNAADEINKAAAELFLNPQALAVFMQQPNAPRAIKAIFRKLSPEMQDYLRNVVAVQAVTQPAVSQE